MMECSRKEGANIENVCPVKAKIAHEKKKEQRKKSNERTKRWREEQKKLAQVHEETVVEPERIKSQCPSLVDSGALVEYKPHAKQRAFHKSKSQSRWLIGGNRTGKTTCGAVEAIRCALYGETEGWVVSLSAQVQRDVAQKKILEFLPPQCIEGIVMQRGNKLSRGKHGIIDFIVVRNIVGTTSKIGFKSCEQSREKFQGTSLDWIWFDEEPPEDIYEEALLRTLDKGGKIWATMTPLKGKTWVFERIFLDNDNHFILQMSWSDNLHLKKCEIAKMKRNLSGEALQSREHGQFSESGGVVFREMSDANIIDPVELGGMEIFLGIDPGYRHPTGAVWVRTDGENFYVVSDYSVAEQSIEEHASALIGRSESLGMQKNESGQISAYIDCAAVQRHLVSQDETVAMKFSEHGINVIPWSNKNVNSSIHLIKSLLKNAQNDRRLKIFRTCTKLIKEMRSLYWGKGENPVKKNDHCLDALRYVLMALSRRKEEMSGSVGKLSEHKRRLTS